MSRRGRRKQRNVNIRKPHAPKMLIVTEGTKTETHYFNSIRDRIQERFRNKVIVEKMELHISGTGRGTSQVVEAAAKLRNRHTYSEVWIVIDRDQFPDFDQAIKEAERENMQVAWSNPSFELWYILHFQEMLGGPVTNVVINRQLSNHLKRNGIISGEYSKANPLLYHQLEQMTEDAVQRSERLFVTMQQDGASMPSKMNPSTTVHEILKTLLTYLL